ncbi:MAG TPA: patatin-like phospholipase family protein [Mucilaginibacter sp.]|jgi:NTE family protein
MKQKVALVLSGGGARGVAHIGVIEEIIKQGFEISSISGTSMGAVIGGVYAMGKMEEYKNWLYTLDKIKLFRLIDFSFTTRGLVKGDKLFNTIKTFIPDANIEDLNIPYAAISADIINKKEVVFTTGSIFDAVRASMAIPSVFTPIKTENGLLIDGGVINNLPINHVKRIPNDILIAVNVNADVPIDKPTITKVETEAIFSIYHKKLIDFYNQLHIMHSFNAEEKLNSEEKLGYLNLMNKTFSLMTYHITQMTLERYSPDVLINVSRHCCGAFDFHKAEEMVETGRHAAIKSLGAYGLEENKQAG